MEENGKGIQQEAGQQEQHGNTQGNTQNQGGNVQQEEKLFTQADVDRIVGNRLARMKQDLETTDAYRRERDEARRELEQLKNDAFLKEQGVPDTYRDYVTFRAMQMVDDKTDFRQAAGKFLKDNPLYAGRGYRVVSTGSSAMNHGSSGQAAGAADIRKAMGLK